MNEINVTNEMLEKAQKLLIIYKKTSIPFLQKHLKITAPCAKAIIKILYGNNKLLELNNLKT
tara:strand:+ start:570 stop:755 length:186 start_codon:yes stop_codon:yes gene_type:complete